MPGEVIKKGPDYVVERDEREKRLVLTGPWNRVAARVLASGEIDVLVINYAKGFEGADLDFLEAWPLRGLRILDRQLLDLGPIERLGGSLVELAVEAAPTATLEPEWFSRLQVVQGSWRFLEPFFLADPRGIMVVRTGDFDETSFEVFADHSMLREITIKGARRLESVDGIEELVELSQLWIALAPRLTDLSAIPSRAESLIKLRFDTCRKIGLEEVARLAMLRTLDIVDCGSQPSFAPLVSLKDHLEGLGLGGSTRADDCDLSPLLELSKLKRLGVAERRGYNPSVKEIKTALGIPIQKWGTWTETVG